MTSEETRDTERICDNCGRLVERLYASWPSLRGLCWDCCPPVFRPNKRFPRQEPGDA